MAGRALRADLWETAPSLASTARSFPRVDVHGQLCGVTRWQSLPSSHMEKSNCTPQPGKPSRGRGTTPPKPRQAAGLLRGPSTALNWPQPPAPSPSWLEGTGGRWGPHQ